MSIASSIIAIAYLLVIFIGAVGALLLFVWLFGETPKSTRDAKIGEEENTPAASAGIEPPEDRAA